MSNSIISFTDSQNSNCLVHFCVKYEILNNAFLHYVNSLKGGNQDTIGSQALFNSVRFSSVANRGKESFLFVASLQSRFLQLAYESIQMFN